MYEWSGECVALWFTPLCWVLGDEVLVVECAGYGVGWRRVEIAALCGFGRGWCGGSYVYVWSCGGSVVRG